MAQIVDSAVQRINARRASEGKETLSEQIGESLGAEKDEVFIDEKCIEEIRVEVAGFFKCTNWQPIDENNCKTCVRTQALFSSYAHFHIKLTLFSGSSSWVSL